MIRQYQTKPVQIGAARYDAAEPPPKGVIVGDLGHLVTDDSVDAYLLTYDGNAYPLTTGDWILYDSQGDPVKVVSQAEFIAVFEPVE